MLKYLLPAWQKALDKNMSDNVKSYADKDKLGDAYKGTWYNISCWVDAEIEAGDMVKEFKPFAHAYMKAYLQQLIINEKDYRGL